LIHLLDTSTFSQVEAYGLVPAEKLGKCSEHRSRNTVTDFFRFRREPARTEAYSAAGYEHCISASKFDYFSEVAGTYRWLSGWFLPESYWNWSPKSFIWVQILTTSPNTKIKDIIASVKDFERFLRILHNKRDSSESESIKICFFLHKMNFYIYYK
jgi:hypothetical protein